MKVSDLQNEIKYSRAQRHLSLAVLSAMLALTLLNFSLVNSALPALNSIGPQGKDGATGQTIKGKDGYTPIKGIDYFDGQNGLSITGPSGPAGLSIQGPQGEQGATGAQGEAGRDGKQLEERCTPGTPPRVDQRYTGDDNWQVAYYLPIGSSCP